ncbi:prolipoprotein diacylglyceryl transferase [Pontibacter qinzhouensis]|uniref:Prolipoprotein diacylglyceryl transferase n=1 Tax=Pontibacter qinzhouensis TaxID=2603253 RepID=A0A5C8JJ34_9BACT|nr:prolipoprotein diacylglyceryl transferase family protein [Pontibacter qinzhouensis]TXK36704.1 prolipoprotein diacylglyceryl transferase [Pontibacter qinzhouensis]
MSSLLFIIDTKGDDYFDLIYICVFLLAVVWLWREGFKRKFDSVAWALSMAVTWFLFITGTKMFAYSASDWKALLLGQQLPITFDKVLFGGLFLSVIGFIFLKRILRLNNSALDAFAFLLPLAIGIQRVGCLLAGCCHGIVNNAGWGAQYKPVTLPHYHQFQAGLLEPGQYYSLPVHPTQLYELAAGLVVVAIVFRLKRQIKASGNTLVLAIGLYSFFRFFIEFFRDTAAHASGGTLVADLKIIQWILLLTMALLSLLFIHREQTHASLKVTTPPVTPALYITLPLLLSLLVATWSLKNWFSYAEFVALHTALLPAMAVVSSHVFRVFTIPQYRWLTAAILIVPVFLMSQAFPEQRHDSVTAQSYHTVKIGYGTGDYHNSHNIGTGSGCARVSNTSYFHQEYVMGGAGYAVTKPKREGYLTFGVNAYAGTHEETDITPGTSVRAPDKNIIVGVNPYVYYDTKWLGIGGGLHAGNLSYTIEDGSEEGTSIPKSGSRKTPLYPQARIRIGPTRVLFGELRLADHFPTPMPGLRFQASVGSGFGLKNGTFIRVGSNGVNDFISGQVVLNNRFVIEPLFLWGDTNYGLFSQEYKQRQFTLGLQYRFNHQDEKILRR